MDRVYSNKGTRFYPLTLALSSAALFGAATPACKVLLSDLSPFQLAGLLYLGAGAAMAPTLIRRGTLQLPSSARRVRLLLAGAVVLGGILAPILLLLGLRLASAASISMWLPLELLATAVLGRLIFREHIGVYAAAGLVGVVLASVLLGIGETAAGVSAGLLVGAACVCWGVDNNCTALIDGMSIAEITFWKGLTAGTVNLGIGLLRDGSLHAVGAVGGALVVGALSYGTSISLYIAAARMIGATRAQSYFAGAPFFGVALAVVVLGDSMSAVQMIAALILIGSLTVLFRDRHVHWHVHAPHVHEHAHRRDDGHHLHEHPGRPATHRHTHRHEHAQASHSHRHWPDLHHRHQH